MRSAAALLLVLVACDDDVLGVRTVALDHEEHLDFGLVPVGTSRTRTLTLSNPGGISVRVERFRVDSPPSVAIGLSPASVAVAPGVELPVEVTFSPRAVTGPLELELVLVTAELGERTVRLTGEGVREGLVLSPRPLDFGRVLRGRSSTRVLDVESVSFEDNPLSLSIEPPDRFSPDEPVPARIRAGDRISVRFRYTPAADGPAGDDLATATWSFCPDQACRVEVPFTGFAVTEPVTCTPIDFGALRPGTAKAAATTCMNQSDRSLVVTDASLSLATDPAFSVVDPGALGLDPGASVAIGVRLDVPAMAPTGPRMGELQVRFSDADDGVRLRPVPVPITARVGGPALRVNPEAVDFGRTAVGVAARSRIELRNIGEEPLLVENFQIDGPFAVEAAPSSLMIDPGRSERLALTFTPAVAGPARGNLRFSSDDPERPAVEVSLRGRALDLSNCQIEFVPDTVDFGALAPFRSTGSGVLVRNIGEEPCLVRDPRVVGSAFSFKDGGEDALLLPGEAARYVLGFTPMDNTAERGGLEVTISNRAAPLALANIRGQGAFEALLRAPDAVDFGEVSPECGATEMVRIYNPGPGPIVVSGADVWSSGGSFSVEGELPEEPIEPDGFAELRVRYSPGSEPEIGVLTWRTGSSSPPAKVALFGQPSVEPFIVELYQQGGPSSVDMLIVLDSSNSMARVQATLPGAFPRLLDTARERGVDLRLAVVNMDTQPPCRANLTQPPAGARPGDCGFFSQGDGRRSDPSWRVLSADTVPSFAEAVAHTVNLGVAGSAIETGFLAARLALAPRRLLGYNRGLLDRSDRFFAIIFVSDEEEQSPGLAARYEAEFAAIAGALDRDRYTLTGILVDEVCFAAGASRYLAAVRRAGGVVGTMCPENDDFGPVLDQVGRAAFGQRQRFSLRRPALSQSIIVEVDGVPVEATRRGRTRWRYLPADNAVEFEPESVPAFGSEVILRYHPRCELRIP